jgi:predicted TPR repeat methyltransferase
LSSLGQHDAAAEASGEALKLGPEDLYVRHLAATSGAVPGDSRAPGEYIRAVFDGYADRFEAHLISLGYRVPGLLRSAVLRHPEIATAVSLGPVLDMGCGTGLLAVALSDLPVGPLIGVDVSGGMLAQAADKQLYAELHQADALVFLREDRRSWPLVIAADVLCYFGAVDELFAAVRARLPAGGWFAFSCETLQPDYQGVVPGNGDWSLGRQGRYAHAPGYVSRAAAAAGLSVRKATVEILRREADAPVPGLIVVLERPRDDG